MPVSLNAPDWRKLRREGNAALKNEWLRAGLDNGTGEVPAIKNLVQEGLPRLERAWQRILGSLNIRFNIRASICHPIPQVRYSGSSRACELADLLIVHDHDPVVSAPERRAALIQAKLFGSAGVTARNDVQKGLYERWPEFTYTQWPGGLPALEKKLADHAGIPRGTPGSLMRNMRTTDPVGRHVGMAETDSGSRYAMIDLDRVKWDRQFQSSPWRLCSARVGDLYRHKQGTTLPGYLMRMVAGRAGRETPQLSWPADLPSACHWSLVVTELLEALPQYGGAGGGAPADAFDDSDGVMAVIGMSTVGRSPLESMPTEPPSSPPEEPPEDLDTYTDERGFER